jgi:TPR repeat protein
LKQPDGFKRVLTLDQQAGCALYGQNLWTGNGTQKHYAEAMRYFQIGARSQDRSCYGFIGLMYLNGEGFLVDKQ